jgi:predicted nuclease of predicted toxin-antitoxin system
MKLLLDENLPHQLRHELPGHDCYTVAFMGWAGVENGELLARASAGSFDALLTKDAKLRYEQNLANLPIAVVVLHAVSNDIDDVHPCSRHC